MSTETKFRLGDRLLEDGLIDEGQLEVALNEQRRAYRPLGEILISLGFVREEHVARLLAESLGLPFMNAQEVHPDPLLVSAIDREFVRRTGSFPIRLESGVLGVVMVSPDSPEKVSSVREHFPYPLSLSVTTESELDGLMRTYLPENEARVAQVLEGTSQDEATLSDDFPVEKVTLALLLDGIHRGATDIHIEPEEKVTRVRYRIDGILSQGENLPRAATEAIVSRVKILSHLDISERRRPQDGRLRLEVNERTVDMRVSVMPCTDGENIVLRILDGGGGALRLSELGMAPGHVQALERISDRPHGLFLVTGPTGSGKTTTLYAMLSGIDAMHRNVTTIEDPVEYRLPLLRQSQADPGIGYTFKEGLRSLLRQDPDVILVGEIRDHETADLAIKASMTGHLVFSTLHTNSAIGALPRLVDLGIEPYLVEDTLIGVLAQRLVRRNCRHCSEPATPTPAELEWLNDDAGGMRRGKGCDRCGGSGFSGRTNICELFLPDEAMAEVLRSGADLFALRKLAAESGFQDMNVDGQRKVREGVTVPSEIQRVNLSHRLSQDEREEL